MSAPAVVAESDCLWCERDCLRCGFPINAGWQHVEQPQPEGSGLTICNLRRVVLPLVDCLLGYLQHREQHRRRCEVCGEPSAMAECDACFDREDRAAVRRADR